MLVFPLYSPSAVIFAALYHAELAAPSAAYIQLKAVIRTSKVRGRPRVHSKGTVHVGQVPCILRTLAGALLAIPRGFIVAKFARQISRTCITSRPRGDRGFLEQRATARLLVSRHCHRTTTVTEVTKLATQTFCAYSWCDRSMLVEIHCKCRKRDAIWYPIASAGRPSRSESD